MVRVLIVDSGVGGLTVLGEARKLMSAAQYVYVADNARFPYGALEEAMLIERVSAVVGRVAESWTPDVAVIACNTASTLVLPVLRARFDFPFVGTVPAIKPAAESTESGLISVLATPGTIARDYTLDLIRSFAVACRVTLVASERLAALAEDKLSGGAVDTSVLSAEIAPAFVEEEGRRTDRIVLGCTHYPLLLEELRATAPWSVEWVDPAPAIARRIRDLAPAAGDEKDTARPGVALFTRPGAGTVGLLQVLRDYGFAGIEEFDPDRPFSGFDS